ncbi:MAG: hypothetical protein IPM92_14555 [Saprospiraceae bacterium]|nr:hypothetical protein [Saprospiraceae bacterium]
MFDHKAGDKIMIDFAGKKLHLLDPDSGEPTPVEVFVGILPVVDTHLQSLFQVKPHLIFYTH